MPSHAGPMPTRSIYRAEFDRIDLSSLEPLFRPASVAIIGASSDPEKIGGIPLKLLKAVRLEQLERNAADLFRVRGGADDRDGGGPKQRLERRKIDTIELRAVNGACRHRASMRWHAKRLKSRRG